MHLCEKNNQKYAIKIYNQSLKNNKEHHILSILDHPNIISITDKGPNYIAFNYEPNGDILNFVLANGFQEKLARYYFI